MSAVRLVALSVVTFVLAACSGTETVTAQLAVGDVWARSTPNNLGAVYATFTSDVDDELVDAQVEETIAGTVELHEVVNDGGVMRMQQVPAVPVQAGEARELRPGDYHVMLIDMVEMLPPGTTFPITFVFASGRTLEATAEVRMIEDDTMSHGHHMEHHDHDHHDHDHETPMHHGMPRG